MERSIRSLPEFDFSESDVLTRPKLNLLTGKRYKGPKVVDRRVEEIDGERFILFDEHGEPSGTFHDEKIARYYLPGGVFDKPGEIARILGKGSAKAAKEAYEAYKASENVPRTPTVVAVTETTQASGTSGSKIFATCVLEGSLSRTGEQIILTPPHLLRRYTCASSSVENMMLPFH